MGEQIEFPSNGTTAGGYLASGEGAGLGLVVIREGGGGPHIRSVCDRLAAEGFTALAPDLQEGKAVNVAEVGRDLSGAVDFLVDHPAVRGHGVGAIGFGLGGGLALWLAGLRPDQVQVVVPFYGALPWPDAQPDWDRIAASVEGHYGERDDWATPAMARDIEEKLDSRGRDVRLFFYPTAGHAFFDETRPEAYDEDASRQAWVRTLEFLRAKLG
ncbi:MAG: dienelactone hydrolase family protein [Acidimicrobiales bacterium]|nr:dienelactone hydrolase family protein [Actinomycetota bacterium]